MDIHYVKSVQQWLVDIGLLKSASYEWTPEAHNALAGAALRDSAVNPSNLTLLRHAPVGYKFINGKLVKHEEELVEKPTEAPEPLEQLHVKKKHKK